MGSLLTTFAEQIAARLAPDVPPVEVLLVAALVDIGEQGTAIDTSFVDKQPDWTYDTRDSGRTPVDRLLDHRADDAGAGTTP